jgi:hypothetical protein
VNELPETTLKGALTLVAAVTVDAVGFCTVKIASIAVPVVVVPRLTAAVGLTLTSARATALTGAVHGLSLPLPSTAVMAVKYVVPATRLEMR